VAKGVITHEEANRKLSDELAQIIFQAGFSTREKADAISGRGLGLDIVRKGIDSVDGTIRILSTSTHGTSFEIHVPLNNDFSPKKIKQLTLVAPTPEEEEKSLLLDELAGFLDRLTRAWGS